LSAYCSNEHLDISFPGINSCRVGTSEHELVLSGNNCWAQDLLIESNTYNERAEVNSETSHLTCHICQLLGGPLASIVSLSGRVVLLNQTLSVNRTCVKWFQSQVSRFMTLSEHR